MLSLLRYITLVLTLSALLTLYLTLLVTVPVDQVDSGNFNPKSVVKEVVAYSLRKQIEIESEEVPCDEFTSERANFINEREDLWIQVPETNLYVFGVYYDDRLEPFRYLRLLGMIKGTWNRTLYCQTQSENNTYHITKAIRTEIWVREWDIGDEETFNPVLISCYIPTNSTPNRLSLNINPCKINPTNFKVSHPSTNKIKISSYKRHKKYFMTVCVKPLDFTKDISNRLMQWIEMNRILGADKFEMFVHTLPQKVMQTLEFYSYKYKREFSIKYYQNVEDFAEQKLNGNELEEQKRISRRGSTLITKQTRERNNEITAQEENSISAYPQLNARRSGSVKKKRQNHNQVTARVKDVGIGRVVSTTVNNTGAPKRKIWQKRRNELMAYNDCLYRNLRSSHFVIPVDIDEIIVPKRFYTWDDALGHLFASAPHLLQDFASFSAQNVYFLEEFSKKPPQNDAFFFEYTQRSEFSEEGESGKSFVSTKNAITVFNHYALDALRPGIRKTYFLPRELVQMNHYKQTCSVNLLPQCAKYLSSPVRIVDTLLNKYKREFIENYEKIVSQFDVFKRKRNLNKTGAS